MRCGTLPILKCCLIPFPHLHLLHYSLFRVCPVSLTQWFNGPNETLPHVSRRIFCDQASRSLSRLVLLSRLGFFPSGDVLPPFCSRWSLRASELAFISFCFRFSFNPLHRASNACVNPSGFTAMGFVPDRLDINQGIRRLFLLCDENVSRGSTC